MFCDSCDFDALTAALSSISGTQQTCLLVLLSQCGSAGGQIWEASPDVTRTAVQAQQYSVLLLPPPFPPHALRAKRPPVCARGLFGAAERQKYLPRAVVCA